MIEGNSEIASNLSTIRILKKWERSISTNVLSPWASREVVALNKRNRGCRSNVSICLLGRLPVFLGESEANPAGRREIRKGLPLAQVGQAS